MEKISWKTSEHIHTEKTNDWYWIVVIITISIAIISIILNDAIFAILILVSSFTLALFASKKPKVVEAHIEDSGVTIGNTHYPYVHINSFWVETREIHPRILLKSKKIFMPYIVILLEDMDPGKVRLALLQHLPEEEHSEPLLEKVLIYLGF